MNADFLEQTVLPGYGQKDWVGRKVTSMKLKGATCFRLSHPPDKPDEIYLEGWKKPPENQGIEPWRPKLDALKILETCAPAGVTRTPFQIAAYNVARAYLELIK